MQKLMNIYNEYKKLPKLIDLCESVIEDNLKNEQTFLQNPTLKNLKSLILNDLHLSNFSAERFLARLLVLELTEQKNDKVTLLEQPQVVAFEDLKEGDIYLEDFSNIFVFFNYTQSAVVNFSNSLIEEKFDFTINDISRESNIFLLGKIDLK